ncbi:MAG: PKD domain-containing protein [Pseudomonadota bacterium]
MLPDNAADLRITLSGGNGEADLFVRKGTKPTQTTYDCRPLLAGNEETCVFADPGSPATYFLMIRARAEFEQVTIRATYRMNAADNQIPSAAFSIAQQATTGVVEFDASSSTDADGTIESYEWTFGDGAVASGPMHVHSYATPGTYSVSLTVFDNAGASDTTTMDVLVPAADDAEILAFEDVVADLRKNGKWRASFALPAGATDLRVDMNGGSGDADLYVRKDRKPSQSVYDCRPRLPDSEESCFFADPGAPATYFLFVRARSASSDIRIRANYRMSPVANRIPTASFTANPQTGTTLVEFDAGASMDPDGSIDSYQWSFGDNSVGTGELAEHQYDADGVYTITLTVVDNDGDSSTASQEVVVDSQASPIAVSLTYNSNRTAVRVDWTGASGRRVDVLRAGVKLKTTANDGRWQDNKPVVSAAYQVCESGTQVCSLPTRIWTPLLGLVLAYRFDEQTGDLVEDAGPNNIHAMLEDFSGDFDGEPVSYQAPVRVLSLNDGVANLNTATGYTGAELINVGNDARLNPTALTIMAWVRYQSLDDDYRGSPLEKRFEVMEKIGGYWLNVRTSNDANTAVGTLRFGLRNSISATQGGTVTVDSNVALIAGMWHHVVGTYDGERLRVYLDGDRVGQVVSAVNVAPYDHPLVIGAKMSDVGLRWNDDTARPPTALFNGSIDEVRVYDRALSDLEVKAIFETPP